MPISTRMHVNMDDDPIDALDELDKEFKSKSKPPLNIKKPSNDNKDEKDSKNENKNDNNNDNSDTEKQDINFTENQTSNMIVLIWILLIISIILIVVTGIFDKKDKTDTSENKNIINNYVSMNGINATETVYQGEMTVSKKVQIEDGNIIPELYGIDDKYKKEMCIPCTMKEYNTINTGDVIEIRYSRLMLNDSTEKIIILEWNVKTS